MTTRLRKIVLLPSVTAGFALAAVAPAAAAEEFIPFVTDFGRTSFSQPAYGVEKQYIAWVTDFGRAPTPAPVADNAPIAVSTTAAETGLDWGGVAIGVGLGIAFVLVALAATIFVLRMRPRGAGGRATA